MAVRKKEIFKISLLTLIILCLITAWLAFGKRGFIYLYRMEKERQTYLERIEKLEQANEELLEEIRKLQYEKDYIEKLARKELGMIKENEVIYRFSRNEDNQN